MDRVLTVSFELKKTTPSSWDFTQRLDHIRDTRDVREFVHQLMRSFRHTHCGMPNPNAPNTRNHVRDLPPGLTKVINAYMKHAMHREKQAAYEQPYTSPELQQLLRETLVSECKRQDKNIKTGDRIFLQELTKHDVLIAALHQALLALGIDIMYVEHCSEWLNRHRFFWYERSPGSLLLFRTIDGRQPVYNGNTTLSDIISKGTARVFESQLKARDSLYIIKQLWVHSDSIIALGHEQNISWHRTDTEPDKYRRQLTQDKMTWLTMCSTMQSRWMRKHAGDTYKMGVGFGNKYGMQYNMACFPHSTRLVTGNDSRDKYGEGRGGADDRGDEETEEETEEQAANRRFNESNARQDYLMRQQLNDAEYEAYLRDKYPDMFSSEGEEFSDDEAGQAEQDWEDEAAVAEARGEGNEEGGTIFYGPKGKRAGRRSKK
jgi:hypothetical protein